MVLIRRGYDKDDRDPRKLLIDLRAMISLKSIFAVLCTREGCTEVVAFFDQA